jgi:hypothetical protein
VLLFVEEKGLPAHVAVEPTVAAPPRPARAALDPENVRRLLAGVVGSRSGGRVSDWQRIEILAVAARVAPGTEALVLAQLPNRPVPAYSRGGVDWIAGPLVVQGWRLYPPIAVRLLSDGGVVRLRVTAHWSPWSEAPNKERAFLDEAMAALRDAGFEPEA